jgi:hypothetical protein
MALAQAISKVDAFVVVTLTVWAPAETG